MKTEMVEEQLVVRDTWSDDMRADDFLAWLEENHRARLRPDTYQRAREHCANLLAGRGVPKSPLTPRRRFCSGVPLLSLRLDWSKIEESALDVANLYAGPAAAEGGLLWCVRRLQSYGDAERRVRIRGRRECFYKFLCATQREGKDVGVLGEQPGILRLVAGFVGIRAPDVCSDATCNCVFSSCQVAEYQVKMHVKSKVRSRKWKIATRK